MSSNEFWKNNGEKFHCVFCDNHVIEAFAVERGMSWGRYEERNKIINLIEANAWEFTIIGDDGVKYELGDKLIALIKGEK